MHRHPYCTLPLLALLASVGAANGQTKVAPFYALPADGCWVEYESRTRNRFAKEQKGVLRISSVGQKQTKDDPHRWIEIKMENGASNRIRKLLVAEKAFAKGQSFEGNIAGGYEKKEGDPVTQLTKEQIHIFVSMGITGELREISAKEAIETRLGKYTARHVTASTQAGNRLLEYHCWLVDQVPFGWAKFEIRERVGDTPARVLYSAEAVRSGKSARSELDETKAGKK